MRQHLLIDADDTLWENNIYFERAIEAFIAFLDHSALTPAEVRAVLDEIEMTTQGYGSASFARNLEKTYTRLAERDVREEDLEQVREFARQITQHPMQVLDGVKDTLEYLAPRHDLILLTKGHEEEQRLKIEDSGLGIYFQHTLVVAEKDVGVYTELVEDFRLNAALTWMIGNSPKSDINPSLAAGVNAVYIPHPHTWRLEHQDILAQGKGQLLQLERFAELRNYF